jgi:hypothetical protein
MAAVGAELTEGLATQADPIHRFETGGDFMKRQMLSLVGVLALLLVGASAYAQNIKVKATVPFDFIVNGKTLPAGEYTIASFGSVDGRTLMVRSGDLDKQMLVRANSSESLKVSDKTKLVFHRYDQRYFLSEIWVAGNDRGHQIPRGGREKELALDYPVQDVVVLAQVR